MSSLRRTCCSQSLEVQLGPTVPQYILQGKSILLEWQVSGDSCPSSQGWLFLVSDATGQRQVPSFKQVFG